MREESRTFELHVVLPIASNVVSVGKAYKAIVKAHKQRRVQLGPDWELGPLRVDETRGPHEGLDGVHIFAVATATRKPAHP